MSHFDDSSFNGKVSAKYLRTGKFESHGFLGLLLNRNAIKCSTAIGCVKRAVHTFIPITLLTSIRSESYVILCGLIGAEASV